MNSTDTRTGRLADVDISTKIKLAFLWTAVTFLYIYGDYFELYIPEKTNGLVTGNNLLNSPVKLLAASVLLAIPACMIGLSVLLRPAFNKWLNVAVGLFFSIITLLIAATSITPWRAFYVLYALLESGITMLIVWCAINWPRQKMETP